jgi:hypothetical protein
MELLGRFNERLSMTSFAAQASADPTDSLKAKVET